MDTIWSALPCVGKATLATGKNPQAHVRACRFLIAAGIPSTNPRMHLHLRSWGHVDIPIFCAVFVPDLSSGMSGCSPESSPNSTLSSSWNLTPAPNAGEAYIPRGVNFVIFILNNAFFRLQWSSHYFEGR